MIRKVLAVLALVVCSVVAMFVASAPGAPPDPFVGTWSATDEQAANGPLVIRVTKTDDVSYAISGLVLPGGIFTEGSIVDSGLVSSAVSPITGGATSVTLAKGSDDETLTITFRDAGNSVADPITLGLARLKGTEEEQTNALGASFNLRADEKARQGVLALQAALEKWAGQHDGTYPPSSGVAPRTDFAGLLTVWPLNAFTGAEMLPGGDTGSYSYKTTGDSYSLGTTLSSGTLFEVR